MSFPGVNVFCLIMPRRGSKTLITDFVALIPDACMNNDSSVMCKPYAWKVLGILPVLKASAFTNQDEEWQRQRRLRLYHRSMDFVIADENDLCKEGRYFRFADKIVWARQAGLRKAVENLGFIILPFRPFSPGRGPGSASRYWLVKCDIIYDIPILDMMSQFAIYDIIYDIIKIPMISHCNI